MGQEIQRSHFRKVDFERYESRLREETALLEGYFRDGRFSADPCTGGFELEAWLVNDAGAPLAENDAFLSALNSPMVVPELARFNVELNGPPCVLVGDALKKLHADLADLWARCQQAAQSLGGEVVMAGILPTVREQELVLDNISAMTRYKALNEQVQRLRRGRPLELDIQGREHLKIYHSDVMLESAATSFQLHLQVPIDHAVRAYNAAIALSAPIVAATANSPYLFGYDLWDETRIPLFEQSVSLDAENVCSTPRVTFGSGYAVQSLMECFVENLQRYPVLLPETLDSDPATLSYLRLHNGTIWRWNRPLIGIDADGAPHLRIEHRVIPSGPSLIDGIANAALFFGLACEFAQANEPLATRLPFADARDNFYAAARDGLGARLRWLNGNEATARELLLEWLLPMARQGLKMQGIDDDDVRTYMAIIEARVRTGRNGAAWQRAFVARHGRDMAALTAAYREHQRGGAPVHEWKI